MPLMGSLIGLAVALTYYMCDLHLPCLEQNDPNQPYIWSLVLYQDYHVLLRIALNHTSPLRSLLINHNLPQPFVPPVRRILASLVLSPTEGPQAHPIYPMAYPILADGPDPYATTHPQVPMRHCVPMLMLPHLYHTDHLMCPCVSDSLRCCRFLGGNFCGAQFGCLSGMDCYGTAVNGSQCGVLPPPTMHV